MDRNGILILVVAALLFFLMQGMVDDLFPPPARQSASPNNATVPLGNNATALAGNNGTAPAGNNGTALAGNNGTPPAGNNGTAIKPAAPSRVFRGVQLAKKDANATDANAVKPSVRTSKEADIFFTESGGAISIVRLNGHIANITETAKNKSKKDKRVGLNLGVPEPIFKLSTGNVAINTGDGEKTLLLTGEEKYTFKDDVNTAIRTATAELLDGPEANRTVKIIKEFPALTGFMMSNVVVKIRNDSPHPVRLPPVRLSLGAATDTGISTSDAMYNGVFLFNGADAIHWDQGDFANRTMGCFPGTPIPAFTNNVKNTRWVASHNQFFTIAAMMSKHAEGEPADRWLPDSVEARWIDIADLNNTLRMKNRFGVSANYVNYNLVLSPGQEYVVARLHLYTGPREYHTFEKLAIQEGNQIDALMDLGGFWGFFSKILLLSMIWLHDWGLSYALAIIVITIVIKIIFWPLSAASTRSMKRMSKFQPQMKEIQEKFKDDPQKMNQKLMHFMREKKVNPLAGCLPMLIQIPVFFGFFFMIRTAVELRGAPFLWASDLSSPDTIFTIPGIDFIPLFSNASGLPVNPLPILMGATMIIQMRLTPQTPGADPMQAKMMKFLPLIFIPILYNFSAGLTLYWTVQNILTIAQTKMTKVEPDSDNPTEVKTVEQPKERKPRKKRR